MNFLETIKESWRAIRGNLVRAILTMLVIAFGITALIGVNTSIEGIKFWMTNSMSALGSNTFRIQASGSNLRGQMRGAARRTITPISYEQASGFKKKFSDKATISITANGSFNARASFGSRSTESNIQVMGADENYLVTGNFKLSAGRNFNAMDDEGTRNVVIIGSELKKLLFPGEEAVGKEMQVNNTSYQVVGVLEEMGSMGAMGGDKVVLVPVNTLRKVNGLGDPSFGINVYLKDPAQMNKVIVDAIGAFRLIRKLKPWQEDNFSITRSETIVKSLMENLSILTVTAYFIAIITLISAAIGLMNIMLVSVTERTREIGVRKSLGATRGNILTQFLTEALAICLAGGAAGILFGILVGNIISLLIGAGFIIPWNWVAMGVVICTLVGLVSGLYPAWKAARVDPIDALRYE